MLTVVPIEDARATIDAKRTREGVHVRFFNTELLPYLAENANGETIVIDLLAQTTDAGKPLGNSAASLASSYSTKVKQATESGNEFAAKLRVLKRKPASGEQLSVDDKGFACLIIYN